MLRFIWPLERLHGAWYHQQVVFSTKLNSISVTSCPLSVTVLMMYAQTSFVSFLIALCLSLLLAGCFSFRPHQRYKEVALCEASHDAVVSPDETKMLEIRVKYMNIDQLRAARKWYQKYYEADILKNVIERLARLSPDQDERASCIMQLGTLQLGAGELDKARTSFQTFLQEYPGNSARKQLFYRYILAHHWDRATPIRDQEMTRKTMQLCHEFLRQYASDFQGAVSSENQKLLEVIKAIIHSCQLDGLLGDLERLDFYITKYQVTGNMFSLRAAHDRLKEFLLLHERLLGTIFASSIFQGQQLQEKIQMLYAQLKELGQDKPYLQLQRKESSYMASSHQDSPKKRFEKETGFDDPEGFLRSDREAYASKLKQLAAELNQYIILVKEAEGQVIVDHVW